jgi:transcriptional antiterminator RfaH
MGPYWACARTEPSREAVAQHFLGLKGFASYLPRLRVQRHQHGRRVVLRPCLFPNYIFVLIREGHWWNARWCVGVSAMLLAGDVPAAVPDAVIAEIRGREQRIADDLAF